MKKLPGIYVDFAPTKIEREKFQWIRHDCSSDDGFILR